MMKQWLLYYRDGGRTVLVREKWSSDVFDDGWLIEIRRWCWDTGCRVDGMGLKIVSHN